MDKATKAIRRSSIKLKSIASGGGHQDLNLALSQLRDVRSTAKVFMSAQTTASQDLIRWSQANEMKAMQDTFIQFAELNTLWSQAQKEFIDQFKKFIHQFEMILEGEQHLDQARSNVSALEKKEMKIRKELRVASASQKSVSEDVRQLEIKLAQSERSKDLAKLEVLDVIKENEAVKIIRVKEGLTKLSESYMELSSKCQIIYAANKELAQLLPDVHDKNIHELHYPGSFAAEQVVSNAKERVQQLNRPHGAISPSAPRFHDELPPPYSPVGNRSFQSPGCSSVAQSPSTNPFDTVDGHYSHSSQHSHPY